MPDHLHMVLAPKCKADGLVSVSEIRQAIKGVSAHRTNHARQRGKVFVGEESIGDKVDYILGKRVGAGFAMNPLGYRWLWSDTGEINAPEERRVHVQSGD